MIKTIIFDIGNVLIDCRGEDYLCGMFGEEQAGAVAAATFGKPYWKQMDQGVMDGEEATERMIADTPELENEIRKAMEYVGNCLFKQDYAIPWIRELKEKGFQVLFLSNYSEYLRRKNPEVLDFLPYLDGGVFSYEVKMIKPNPDIYQYILNVYKLVPEECIFVDDLAENIEAAKAAGIHGIQFRGYEKSYDEIMKAIYQGKTYESVIHTDILRESPAPYRTGKKDGEYTLDDYYALPKDQRVELIDGVFYEMLAPRTVHQDIEGYMYTVFYEYIRKNKKPCKVFMAPTDVQICCDNRNMLEPDLLVVCDQDKIKGFGICGAPDFVLEILSKSTRKKDMTIKLGKYLEAGVKEYWIIDPHKEKLITYDFTDEDYVPCVYALTGSVPVAISGGELLIDLGPVAESIRELGSLD